MEKFKCPICGCEKYQQIDDIGAGYFPEEKIPGYPVNQEPILINRYVCIKCGYVYHNVSNDTLQKMNNTHEKNDFSNAPCCVSPIEF